MSENIVILPKLRAADLMHSRFSGLHVLARYSDHAPWILADSLECNLKEYLFGSVRVIALGVFSELSCDNSSGNDLHSLFKSLSVVGSAFLTATDGIETLLRGSLSGVRQVYYREQDGYAVATSNSELLATAVDSKVSTPILATKLLEFLPYQLQSQSVWSDIAFLPGNSYLSLRSMPRVSQWWQYPHDSVSMACGADSFYNSLFRAVKARTDSFNHVSADLSGGIDSTALCLIAAEQGNRLTAFTTVGVDKADDDMKYVSEARDYLSDNLDEHILLPSNDLPALFDDVTKYQYAHDEPQISILTHPRQAKYFPILQSRGSEHHLTGLGGDHILWGFPHHYHRAIGRHPVKTISALRGYRMLRNWRVRELLLEFTDRHSYSKYVVNLAQEFNRDPEFHPRPHFGWANRLTRPIWMTDKCATLVIEQLLDCASKPLTFSDIRPEHYELQAICHGGQIVRAFEHSGLTVGLPTSTPYFDDEVITAMARINPIERATPFEFKPLAKAAFHGIVPSSILDRRTKSDGGQINYLGRTRNWDMICEFLERSALVQLGLIDMSKLRRLKFADPRTRKYGLDGVNTVVSTALWLETRKEMQE